MSKSLGLLDLCVKSEIGIGQFKRLIETFGFYTFVESSGLWSSKNPKKLISRFGRAADENLINEHTEINIYSIRINITIDPDKYSFDFNYFSFQSIKILI